MKLFINKLDNHLTKAFAVISYILFAVVFYNSVYNQLPRIDDVVVPRDITQVCTLLGTFFFYLPVIGLFDKYKKDIIDIIFICIPILITLFGVLLQFEVIRLFFE